MVYSKKRTMPYDLLELASRKIDELTFNRIVAIGYDNLTEFQKNMIEKATLAQANYYKEYGTDAEQIQSISIGSYSIGMANSAGTYHGVSTITITYLKQTGLMCKVVR